MTFKFYHDLAGKSVFRMQSPPTVVEKTGKAGKRIGWTVQAEIEITRADNVLLANNQWKYRICAFPQQHFDGKDDRRSVVASFQTQHVPNFPEIDQETYNRLREKYEQEAKGNKPAS